MYDELKNIEKIDLYLSGELSPAERLAFEKEMAENDGLGKEVDLLKAARNAVAQAGRANLKNKFTQFEKEIETPVRRIVPFRWLAAAAAVLVLLIAGVWFSKNNNSVNNNEKIFADHFETYRNPVLIRSGENNSEIIWYSAVDAYAKGDFEKAADLFQQSLNDTATIYYLAHFYRGVSLLSKKNTDAANAIFAFNEVIDSDNDYRLQAKWYKALALIYLNKKAEAKIIFEEINEEGGYKSDEIEKLLEML